jgi:PIN domain nuclease of toxin-antitoxin system
VAIEVRLGKLQADPDELAGAIGRSGFVELPVSAAHGAAVAKLAPHHNTRSTACWWPRRWRSRCGW